MTHSIPDDHSTEMVNFDDPYRDLPRAKPHQRLTRGMEPDRIFGMCAGELDDQFLEDVMAIRRAGRAQGGRHE